MPEALGLVKRGAVTSLDSGRPEVLGANKATEKADSRLNGMAQDSYSP